MAARASVVEYVNQENRLLMFRPKAVRAVCITGSFERGVLGIRIKRPGHDDFAVLFFCGDETVGHFALFDPIHDYRKPIHISGTGTAPAVKTAGNHEEPAIIASLAIMGLHLAIVVDGPLGR